MPLDLELLDEMEVLRKAFKNQGLAENLIVYLKLRTLGLSLEEIRRQFQELYGMMPSDSTVYEWIVRFTKQAVALAVGYKAHTGTTWAADETVLFFLGRRDLL